MVVKKDTLKTYREKRNFEATPEPEGKQTYNFGPKPIYVIQEHHATRLHYDFRIEDEGVLKSWAIPKGPSTDPNEKRLAVQTEDHPLDYASFEGVIPEGNYGAGAVLVWDVGVYKNLKECSISTCIQEGTLALWLEGHKLKGGYALVKTHYDKKSWIFFKMKDEFADSSYDIIKDKPKSVLTGRIIDDIR